MKWHYMSILQWSKSWVLPNLSRFEAALLLLFEVYCLPLSKENVILSPDIDELKYIAYLSHKLFPSFLTISRIMLSNTNKLWVIYYFKFCNHHFTKAKANEINLVDYLIKHNMQTLFKYKFNIKYQLNTLHPLNSPSKS